MTDPNVVAQIKATLDELGASSTTHDTDTVAETIAEKVEQLSRPNEPELPDHDVADGTPPAG